ncbi:MAG: Ig-like domain-containing protein, partial [Candidatus Caldarchaeum sp.]|nr:Ig-like domain-containing protein [Candidatus Caldarchaeum sp.]MDW8435048.1 Ig-like domain-containing protein [Candidatus Caldarchaeum sp.]
MHRQFVLTAVILLLLASFPTLPAQAEQQTTMLSGTLSIMYGDPPTGESYTRYFLTKQDGDWVELQFDEPPPYWYSGRYVEIRGTVLMERDAVRVDAYSTADSMTMGEGFLPQAVGTRRVINILVLFSDHQGPIPFSPTSYDNMFNSPSNSLKHYFLEMSYGKLTIVADIAGNQWFMLPRSKSSYAPCGWGTACANLNTLLIDAVTLADPYVDFSNYDNINIIVGNDLDCCAWGGMATLTLDGVTKTFGITWDPPWAQNMAVFAHEMGHSFGLPHSGWVYAPYDSPWDVMSNAYVGGGNVCGNYYSMNSGMPLNIVCYVPVHTIAVYKDRLGWIDPPYKTVVNPYQTASFTVEALSLTPPSGLKMIRIDLPNQPAGHFYTVEVRRHIGYDSRLPNQGVIIHKYEEGRNRCINGRCGSGPAYPIDSTPNDNTLSNAQWSVGQTFTDTTTGLRIIITAASGNSFTVAISWTTGPPTPSISVTYPNGGETITIGSSVNIQWASQNLAGNVDILLSRDGGTSWTVLFGNTANDGSQPWTATGPSTSSAKIRIRSTADHTVYDDSDNVFTIVSSITVTSPNGGETWEIGTTQTITWSSLQYQGTVKIEISRNGGRSWTTIVSSTPNDGSHPWTVRGPLTSNALIRITSNQNPSNSDTSNAAFSITDTTPPSVRVTTPNGGESIQRGRTYTIRWSASDAGGIQRIEI